MKGIKNIRLREYDVAHYIIHFPKRIEGLNIDYYVIMPTHLHIIFVFEECELKLGEVVRRLKAVTSKRTDIKRWQPNYYEHVIRDEKALSKIRTYIVNNPLVAKIEFTQFYE